MTRHLRLLPILAAFSCDASPAASPSPPSAAFLRAHGTQIISGDTTTIPTPVFLKGVSLGNEVWANRALPTDHAEIDFQRLADMGANSTRFLLNYLTFETDAGWAWIDQNVAWAKAHNIRLVFNMHVPQGSCISAVEPSPTVPTLL